MVLDHRIVYEIIKKVKNIPEKVKDEEVPKPRHS
jgi:hypothetical protein